MPAAVADADSDATPLLATVINTGDLLPAQHKLVVKLASDSDVSEPETSTRTVVLQVVQLGVDNTEVSHVIGNLVFEALPLSDIEFEVGITLRSEGVLKAEAIEQGTKQLQEFTTSSK
jgi:hypothetical protein